MCRRHCSVPHDGFRVSYMVPMLTISHVAITASTYLITFAAIERLAFFVPSAGAKHSSYVIISLIFQVLYHGKQQQGDVSSES